jgi:OmpA-OmpF porin, OOP family
MKRLTWMCAIALVGCSGHAELKVKMPTVKIEPKPVAVQAPPKEEPKPEPPPPPVLVEATTTGAQIDVPGTIEFDRDKASMHHTLPGTQDTLENVRKILVANPQITKLRIEGHTDSDGLEASNQSLSERRAQLILKWLVSKGIDEGRLTAVGCAAKDPLVSNTSEANKQKNRRTEFDIEEVDGKRPADYTDACAPNPKR